MNHGFASQLYNHLMQNQFFGFGYLDVNQNCLTLRLGNLSNPKLTFSISLFCGLNTMKQTCSQFELNFNLFLFYTQILGLNNWPQKHFIGWPCPGESHSDDLASSLPDLFHWHPSSTCKVPKQKHFYITVNSRCSWFDVYHFVLDCISF